MLETIWTFHMAFLNHGCVEAEKAVRLRAWLVENLSEVIIRKVDACHLPYSF